MSILITGPQITEPSVITANTVTSVFTAIKRTTITALNVCPTSGTPNLSVSRYDGTVRTYIRKAVPMTAGTAFIYDTPFVLNPGDKLEITSSAAGGDMDVMTTYAVPDAPATQR